MSFDAVACLNRAEDRVLAKGVVAAGRCAAEPARLGTVLAHHLKVIAVVRHVHPVISSVPWAACHIPRNTGMVVLLSRVLAGSIHLACVRVARVVKWNPRSASIRATGLGTDFPTAAGPRSGARVAGTGLVPRRASGRHVLGHEVCSGTVTDEARAGTRPSFRGAVISVGRALLNTARARSAGIVLAAP